MLKKIGWSLADISQAKHPLQEDIDAIKAVSIDDVNSLITELKPGDFTQLCIGPVV